MLLRRSAAGPAAAAALLAVLSPHRACPVDAFSAPSLRSAATAPRRKTYDVIRTVSLDSDSSGNPNRNQHASIASITGPFRLPSPTQLYSSVSDEQDSKAAEQQQEEDSTAAVLKQTFESPQSKNLGRPIPYGELTVGVMRETYKGENRVSLSPDAVGLLTKAGLDVVVESGGAFFACLLVL